VPSRKQRRRRTKDRRHDYEYVFVDDEGNEVDAEDVPQPSSNGSGGKSARKDQPIKAAGNRTVKPASWQRAIRRGALFSPAIFAFVYLLYGSKLGLIGVLFQTVVLLAFFIPFGYLMDKIMYRQVLKRQAANRAKAKASPKAKTR
jgi:hypothetical protein